MTAIIDFAHKTTHSIVVEGSAEKIMDRFYAVSVDPNTLHQMILSHEFCYLSLFDETDEHAETAMLSQVNAIDTKQGLVFIEVLYYGE